MASTQRARLQSFFASPVSRAALTVTSKLTRPLRPPVVMETVEGRRLFTSYTITDLGANATARGLNSSDQVVGGVSTGNGQTAPFLWTAAGGLQQVPNLSGAAYAINDSGVIVGQAAYYSPGAEFPPQGGFVTSVDDLTNTNFVLNNPSGALYAIDNSFVGLAVGQSDFHTSGFDPVVHAAFYNGSVFDDGTIDGSSTPSVSSTSYGISDYHDSANDAVIVGTSGGNGPSQHAFIATTNSGPVDIGQLIGTGTSAAYAINPSGTTVVGFGPFNDLNAPFLYDVASGRVTQVPVLSGTFDARAFGVNDAGVVVGSDTVFSGRTSSTSDAFVRQADGTLQNLNGDIAPGSGWQLQAATAVNANGDIVGYGTLNGQTHAFLLKPNTSVPTAKLTTAPTVTIDGGRSYQFTVSYAGDFPINADSLGDNDVTVLTPAHAILPATLVPASVATDGNTTTATYQITPPGGTWDGNDDGAYAVQIGAGSVTDVQGVAVRAGTIGTFLVNVPKPTGSISGSVYQDGNGDGRLDGTDAALGQQTVYLDTNNNGKFDNAEPYVFTPAAGTFTFTGLAAGTYHVREMPNAGYTVTQPGNGFYDVTLGKNAAAGGYVFGNVPASGIAGTISLTNPTGFGAGWRVYVDTNNDGTFQAGEPTAVTDGKGQYKLTPLPPGSYTVRVTPLVGYTVPSGISASDAVKITSPVQIATANFTYTRSTTVPAANINQTYVNGVDVANGDVHFAATDVTLPDLDLPLKLTRTYDAQNAVDNGLGVGWSLAYTDTLTLGSGFVTWNDSDGHHYTFIKRTNDYATPDGLNGVFTTTGGYKFVSSAGTTYTFSSGGFAKVPPELASIIDRNGNAVTITGLAAHNGKKTIATSSTNAVKTTRLTYAYDNNGHVTAVTDDTGPTWKYAYATIAQPGGKTASGLASVTDPAGGVSAYTYASKTNDPAAGRISTVADADRSTTTYAYDSSGGAAVVYDADHNIVRDLTYAAGELRSVVNDGRGNYTTYTYDAMGEPVKIDYSDGSSRTNVYVYGRLFITADGLRHGTTYSYDLHGNINRVVDPDGNETDTTFNAFAEPTLVTQYRGNATQTGALRTTFTYDAKGNATQEVDAAGNITQNTYYANGLLRARIRPNAAGGSLATSLLYTTNYVYNTVGQVTAETHTLPTGTASYAYAYDNRGNLLSVQDPDQKTTRYTYDVLGRRLTASDPAGTVSKTYDALGLVTSRADPLGRVTLYQYDADHRRTLLVHADRSLKKPPSGTYTTLVTRVGITTQTQYATAIKYAYDVSGNLTSVTDELGRTSSSKFDGLDRVVQSTDASTHATAYAYDKAGRLTSVVDPLQRTTLYGYDNDGRQTSVTDPLKKTAYRAYDGVGDLTNSTDALGNATAYLYDADGRLTSAIQVGTGVGTSYQYDADGNLTRFIDGRGHWTSYSYDGLDRRTATLDAATGNTKIAYDAAGNVLSTATLVTLKTFRTETFAYDADERLTKTTDPLKTGSTTLAYDAAGELTMSTDPTGNKTTFAYDADGRETSVVRPGGAAATTFTYDAAGQITKVSTLVSAGIYRSTVFAYDASGRRTKATDNATNSTFTAYDSDGEPTLVTDALGHTVAYQYDADGHQTKTTTSAGSTTTTYDADGNVDTVVDADHNTTSYDYDGLNRATTQTDPLGTKTFEYDGDGNVTQQVDRDGRTQSYTYDDANRLIKNQWVNASGAPTTSYTYDAAGDLIKVASPDATYAYTYDGDGRVASEDNSGTPTSPHVVLTYNYDLAGRRTSVTDTVAGNADAATTVKYDALGNGTTFTQTGPGVDAASVSVGYDAAGDVTTVNRYANAAGAGTPVGTRYGYDNDGRLSVMSDTFGSKTLSAYTWAYDAASRLTHQTSPDGTDTFAYDDRNQITQATHTASGQSAETFKYDPNGNRNSGSTVGTDNEIKSDGTSTYAYDAEGNRTRQTSSKLTRTFKYDDNNRLTEVTDKTANGTVDIVYTYDALGRRIGKSISTNGAKAVVTRYVYDGQNLLRTFDATGKATDYILNGVGVAIHYADEVAGSGVQWLAQDGQGTVRDVYSPGGVTLDHLTYNAFGGIAHQSRAASPVFAYAGQQSDADTGLVFDNARYYDPVAGRFISRDPLSFSGGDANLYRYAGNNPTNFTDPTGLLAIGQTGAGVVTRAGHVRFLPELPIEGSGGGSDGGGGTASGFGDDTSSSDDTTPDSPENQIPESGDDFGDLPDNGTDADDHDLAPGDDGSPQPGDTFAEDTESQDPQQSQDPSQPAEAADNGDDALLAILDKTAAEQPTQSLDDYLKENAPSEFELKLLVLTSQFDHLQDDAFTALDGKSAPSLPVDLFHGLDATLGYDGHNVSLSNVNDALNFFSGATGLTGYAPGFGPNGAYFPAAGLGNIPDTTLAVPPTLTGYVGIGFHF